MSLFPTIMVQTARPNIRLPESNRFKNDLKCSHLITAGSIHELSHGSSTAISLPFADGYYDQKVVMSYAIKGEADVLQFIMRKYN